jgi:hypothetical protein
MVFENGGLSKFLVKILGVPGGMIAFVRRHLICVSFSISIKDNTVASDAQEKFMSSKTIPS